jgi:hypothetical protein
MPQLTNLRHERFAQEIAKGKNGTDAYLAAGYALARDAAARNAYRLRSREDIKARIDELAVPTARSRARARVEVEAQPRVRRFGRPAITPEIARVICGRIAGGRVLLDVSRDKDLPGARTIYDEMERNPAFAAAIAAARAESAHALAESVIMIADDPTLVAQVAQHGVQWVRNRCDQRRWLAARFNPMYADMHRMADADGSSLIKELEAMTPEQRRAEMQRLVDKARGVLAGDGPVIEGEAEEIYTTPRPRARGRTRGSSTGDD